MVKLGKIMQIFLHVSLKRDNSHSGENRMEKKRCSRLNSRSRVNSCLSETCDEIMGVVNLILAQVREFSLERNPFSLKLESLVKQNKKIKLQIFIFAFESLMYYCLLFVGENSKFYLKYN